MKYVYGPVKSRRLGLSLGISLTPYKTCSFDCVYCQLGPTTFKTLERKEYIPIEGILTELKLWFENSPAEAKGLSYVTFSGSGEPTLNLGLGRLISEIKQISKIPVAIITNSSLLADSSVRREILQADLIVPSLNTVNPEAFYRIDRPEERASLEEIINGLVELSREFKGKIWLEVMLIKGMNDDLRQIKKLKEIADRINPDKIQLNSPVRAPSGCGIFSVNKSKLGKIKEVFGEKCEII